MFSFCNNGFLCTSSLLQFEFISTVYFCSPIVAMAQLISMNIKLNRSEVFDGGEDLHIVVFGMRVVLCFTDTFVLEAK